MSSLISVVEVWYVISLLEALVPFGEIARRYSLTVEEVKMIHERLLARE